MGIIWYTVIVYVLCFLVFKSTDIVDGGSTSDFGGMPGSVRPRDCKTLEEISCHTFVLGSSQKKKVLIPVANGSEDIEVVTVVDILRRAKVDVTVASIEKTLPIFGSQGVKTVADTLIKNAAESIYDVIILPGGDSGVERLQKSRILKKLLKEQVSSRRKYGAIFSSPSVLQKHGLVQGKAVIVSWVKMEEPGSSTVVYWNDDDESKSMAKGVVTTYTFYDYSSGFIHHCNLIDLEYDTKYYYELGLGLASRTFWFTTPPEVGPDVPYTFGLIGDIAYADIYPDHDNTRWDLWGRFAERSTAYQPWIWTAGNHEIDFAPELGETKPFKALYSQERVSNIDYNIVNGKCSPVHESAPIYITIANGGNIEGLAIKDTSYIVIGETRTRICCLFKLLVAYSEYRYCQKL
ncbi:purple acid phosphatase [Artemisia annua]|uniref:Purple acid phosphatase n=1 Tax=Artemisia annua TaxID=35608 RepID=A0A2U1KGF4_ARTAN|nr:purple acid phosphatase [Artemisia annua]